jgi:hypothetical protein
MITKTYRLSEKNCELIEKICLQLTKEKNEILKPSKIVNEIIEKYADEYLKNEIINSHRET